MTRFSSDLTADMTIRQLTEWAQGQRDRCAEQYGLTDERRTEFLLMQALKLSEEVGELYDEVLAHAGYQRPEKMYRYTSDSVASEIADVAICIAILAESLHVDLGKALAAKVDHINSRWSSLS